MIIIYNLSGLILASAGIMAGLVVFMVSGWISPGLLTLAVIWFVGGFWWRNQKDVSPGVKRPFPALYFIPLPFLAVPAAAVAALLLLVVDLGGRAQRADRRAELFRADDQMLDSAAATGELAVPANVALAGSPLGEKQDLPTNVPVQHADSVDVPPDKELRQSDEPEVAKTPEDKVVLRAKDDKSEAAKPAAPTAGGAEGAALTEKVRGILEANCYRCHGQEGASEGGFNFILDLEKLARTVVKPRSPAGSLLYKRLSATDEDVMPPEGENPRPSAADIAVVRSWIEAGAPGARSHEATGIHHLRQRRQDDSRRRATGQRTVAAIPAVFYIDASVQRRRL